MRDRQPSPKALRGDHASGGPSLHRHCLQPACTHCALTPSPPPQLGVPRSMGKRMERGAGTMGRQLDGAIRDVGSAAVAQVDALLQRWVQFFGVLAFLAIALLPLPNVHVSVSTG